jgi:hypothetical protein
MFLIFVIFQLMQSNIIDNDQVHPVLSNTAFQYRIMFEQIILYIAMINRTHILNISTEKRKNANLIRLIALRDCFDLR